MSDVAGLIMLAGRLLFGGFFVAVAGRAHIQQGAMLEGYARSTTFPVPGIAGWPTGVWLVAGGLSVGLGVWPDVGVLMIAAFATIAASYFHRYWAIDDEMQKMTQTQLFWRNVVIVAFCLFMFATFAALGPGLRYAVTTAVFDF
jgi:putative oxidoreductase